MKITKDNEVRLEIIDKMNSLGFGERGGIHQSDLNYCLNKQALRKIRPTPNTEHESLLFGLGLATQDWITGKTGDEEEVELDGIIVTCDSTWNDCPWELKCTYQSSTKPIEDNPHWIRQIMAQCYVTGKTTAYLSRLEIMGNWKWVYRPSKADKIQALVEEFGENWDEHPQLHVYRLEFSQPELERNWGILQERRAAFIKILETQVLLPKAQALAPGGAFECDYCKYKGVECS